MLRKICEMDILQLAKEGDDQAFAQIYKDNRPWIYGMLRRYYLPGGDKDDLMQIAMIGLWQAVLNFEPDGPYTFLRWARIIVRRKLRDAIRSANRHKHAMLNGAKSFHMPVINRGYNLDILILADTLAETERIPPDEWIIGREQATALLGKISARLSDSEWRILVKQMDNGSISKTALDLGLDFKQVDNALQRIRRKTRDVLQEEV